MPRISVRKPAPKFALKDQHGKSHTLGDYAGRVVVLYFYPKDDTPGCTDQACQFRDRLADFRKVKAVVLGVSPDDEASHKKFDDTHALGLTLLADPELKACKAYGVWGRKTLYGRSFMGVGRTTYLIDPEGKVYRRWDRVSVPGHVAEVVDAVRALRRGELPTSATAAKRASKANARKATRTKDSDPPFTPAKGRLGVKSARRASTGRPKATSRKVRGKPRR
ncbi:MAG: peroxiredoxin [Phycisphaerales bacterium]|nr:peroxiredoxin [Phycisphaerales bacterium]